MGKKGLIFRILDFWFSLVLIFQKKIIKNEKNKNKKRFNYLTLILIILFVIYLNKKDKFYIMALAFIFFIAIGISLLKEAMFSFEKCFIHWFFLNMIAFVIASYVGAFFFNNLIIFNIVTYGLFSIILFIITSFIDTGIVIKVNSIYTAIFTIIEKIININYIKNILDINEKKYEIITIFFSMMFIIFLIVTIFSIVKEHWIRKYNKGIDVLELEEILGKEAEGER